MAQFLRQKGTPKPCRSYITCGGHTTGCATIKLHENQGIFVVGLFWVFFPVRVEGIISCVVGNIFEHSSLMIIFSF